MLLNSPESYTVRSCIYYTVDSAVTMSLMCKIGIKADRSMLYECERIIIRNRKQVHGHFSLLFVIISMIGNLLIIKGDQTPCPVRCRTTRSKRFEI